MLKNHQARWSSETLHILKKAGWHPNRDNLERLDIWKHRLLGPDGYCDMFPAAEQALREFGGIRVEQTGPGRECARSPFVFDPMLAEGEADRFADAESHVGGRLFPLGEAIGGHAFLAIAEDGRVFLVADEVAELGKSIYEAVEALVIGLLPRSVAPD